MEVSSSGFVVQNPLTLNVWNWGKVHIDNRKCMVSGWFYSWIPGHWSFLVYIPMQKSHTHYIAQVFVHQGGQFDFHDSSYHFVHMFFQFKSSMFGPRSWYNQVQISPFVPSSSWVRRCPFIHRRVFLVENWKIVLWRLSRFLMHSQKYLSLGGNRQTIVQMEVADWVWRHIMGHKWVHTLNMFYLTIEILVDKFWANPPDKNGDVTGRNRYGGQE
jgi:hypothetical protein